jgi:hypothetical protein
MQNSTDPPAYFEHIRDGHFCANAPARGPWSVDHCHAGPVAGLIARALEHALPEKVLTRMTLDLVRPIPMSGFQITTDVNRDGRTLGQARVKLSDTDGNICVTGSSMHLVRGDFTYMPTALVTSLRRADAAAGPTPLARGKHGEPSFSDFIDVAYPDGVPDKPTNSTGPTKLWMKTPPLLADETLSTAQRLCPLADCGNGISRNAGFYDITFMNTDLTIHFHRETDADWFLSDCISHWQRTGIGLAQAVLSDDDGPVATALQTILLRPTATR